MTYSINFWGSDRKLGNDDNITGIDDIPTLELARAEFDALAAKPWLSTQWKHGYVDGPEGCVLETVNPAYAPGSDGIDAEAAMQQGMAFGVGAYNEANGEDVSEDAEAGPSFR